MNRISKLLSTVPILLLGCSSNAIDENKILQKIDNLNLDIFSNNGEKIYTVKSPYTIYDVEKNSCDLQKTTINVSDTDVASLISQKIGETAIPRIRFDNLEINPRQNTLLWVQALGREFGDRIKVKVVNPDGSNFEDEVLIESISHEVSA